MSKYHFNVPLFTGVVTIKILKKMPKEIQGDAYCHWHKKKDRFDIVLPSKFIPSLSAHECVHASNFIFRAHGQKLDLKNDETQAYMMSHLMEMIRVSYEAYNKKKKKKKKK